jgi:hypothetical protein
VKDIFQPLIVNAAPQELPVEKQKAPSPRTAESTAANFASLLTLFLREELPEAVDESNHDDSGEGEPELGLGAALVGIPKQIPSAPSQAQTVEGARAPKMPVMNSTMVQYILTAVNPDVDGEKLEEALQGISSQELEALHELITGVETPLDAGTFVQTESLLPGEGVVKTTSEPVAVDVGLKTSPTLVETGEPQLETRQGPSAPEGHPTPWVTPIGEKLPLTGDAIRTPLRQGRGKQIQPMPHIQFSLEEVEGQEPTPVEVELAADQLKTGEDMFSLARNSRDTELSGVKGGFVQAAVLRQPVVEKQLTPDFALTPADDERADGLTASEFEQPNSPKRTETRSDVGELEHQTETESMDAWSKERVQPRNSSLSDVDEAPDVSRSIAFDPVGSSEQSDEMEQIFSSGRTQATQTVLDLENGRTWLPRMVQQISTLVDGERSEVRIQLKPDHLGDLSIKLSVERGVMVAEFVVENETVREILNSNLPQLHTALQEQGANVAEMTVNIGFGQERQSQDLPQQSRRYAAKGAPTPGTPLEAGQAKRLTSSPWYRVDLKA